MPPLQDYDEYRCSACKKAIKQQVIKCTVCRLFYHPGCFSKHKVYDKNRELVPCQGPFENFAVGEEETNKTTMSTRDRLGSTETAGSKTTPSSGTKAAGTSDIDLKIDWLVRKMREMKDEIACKKEIKIMIKEAVQEEMKQMKQELEDLRRLIQVTVGSQSRETQRSYSEITKEKRKENIIIVTPKVQQESETTKKLIKEKVDLKNLAMGITKLRKGNKGAVILGCETGEESEKLKIAVQDKLGENFKVTESPQRQSKLKIINIDEEEIKLDDDDLIYTILKQNKVALNNELRIRVVKKIEKRNDKNQSGRRESKEGFMIIETDEKTHELLLNRGKINIGWKKCPVFNYVNVKRCFKCWGYYHIAKNCTREETCYKCAGNHKSTECKATKKRCVNCMYKIQAYNLKISDEHDALNQECPTFKRAIQEEKRRAGWMDNK